MAASCPGHVLMMTGWPSDIRMCSAKIRPVESNAPPAGNATFMVMGRDGKTCAAAFCAPGSKLPARGRHDGDNVNQSSHDCSTCDPQRASTSAPVAPAKSPAAADDMKGE